ncbi:hypothetical protein H5410_010382 [Solanum commersonii]|uniref:Uncharacterized protein n=1 Tax=Solanum commersonii TaxID=4109 RepID=A0A9J6ALE9_SOLCO|nr:hypothetical protein H5410_010382 [Solanum commersonii]
MSTSEVSGGERVQYIFQDIFVKKEVNPCEDLTDDDLKKPHVPNPLYLCQKSHFKFTSEGK